MDRVLLVEPAFPIPSKSRNHRNFLPIGLIKLAALLRSQGASVRLVRGVPSSPEAQADLQEFDPQVLWMTTLFTYWADYVRDAVRTYRELLPKARIVLGGVYASLLPSQQVLEYTGCDDVRQGVVEDAEGLLPAYDLLEDYTGVALDYQIVHASRGCPRHCEFCGTWKLEPAFRPRSSIKDLVFKKGVVFYDNNLLMNPHIETILGELAELKSQNKISWCESQSGFDGRILLVRPHLAALLKKAGFRNPRIAWDHGMDERDSIRLQLDVLAQAGYMVSKEVYMFMVYNWDLSFEEMEAKRVTCWGWKVQISDCRYRPLDQLWDHYRGHRRQTPEDYHIHVSSGWADVTVKQFRRNVREQNICVRHGFPFYSRALETKRLVFSDSSKPRRLSSVEQQVAALSEAGADVWVPAATRHPKPLHDAPLFAEVAAASDVPALHRGEQQTANRRPSRVRSVPGTDPKG